MDTATIERVTETLRETADRVGHTLAEVIIFGSRVRDDLRPGERRPGRVAGFRGVAAYERPKLFYRRWNDDALPEFICPPPAEFEERRRKRPHIVGTAVDEGVSVA